MNTMSEKELYARELRETAVRYDADYFIWGEELIDSKLILYAKKLKEIEGYQEIKDILEPCCLVLADTGKQYHIRCIPAMLDNERSHIYLSVSNFNAIWKQIKRSVRLGIRLAKESGGACCIERPEEIVDMSRLLRTNSIPYIKGDVVWYKELEPTAEERMQNSRRQSLLDNPRMNYFYDSEGGFVHDKECAAVKEIVPRQFCASEEIPDGRQICPRCMRLVCFRRACAPNTKQIPICDRIFRNNHVNTGRVMHYVMEAGLKLHAESLDELIVEGAEDTWIIKGSDEHALELWHNNYVKTSDTERYITDGFHNQGMDGQSLIQMLRYIEGYTWERHLQGEAAKAAAEKKAASPDDRTADVEAREENSRLPWYLKVKNGFYLLLSKVNKALHFLHSLI